MDLAFYNSLLIDKMAKFKKLFIFVSIMSILFQKTKSKGSRQAQGHFMLTNLFYKL